ncbi:MAG: hypothetical protein WD009_00560 [Phycisphaeraceae bacterium]
MIIGDDGPGVAPEIPGDLLSEGGKSFGVAGLGPLDEFRDDGWVIRHRFASH